MDKSQLGRAGELAFQLYALVTSAGELDLYSPVVDDDHVDLVAGPRGGPPVVGIQIKTTDGLDGGGLVEARASFPRGKVREDANFLYGIVLMHSVGIQASWLVRSPDFNRLAYRSASRGREVLEFRASPDREDAFSKFRIDPMQIGSALLGTITESPEAPGWLLLLAAQR